MLFDHVWNSLLNIIREVAARCHLMARGAGLGTRSPAAGTRSRSGFCPNGGGACVAHWKRQTVLFSTMSFFLLWSPLFHLKCFRGCWLISHGVMQAVFCGKGKGRPFIGHSRTTGQAASTASPCTSKQECLACHKYTFLSQVR